MEVVLDRDAFLKGLQMVQNIVEPRQPIPILANVLLETDGKTLRQMLTHTSFAVSHDETRYALNGVLFVVQAKEMRVVATDGHRLAVASRALSQPATPVTGIVPRKAVAEIQRALGAGEEI